jgi:glycosyltransferase involved in cell wall biosynthesis
VYAGTWELIVADNGSSDATLSIARQWQDRLPQLRIVDASGRRGVSHARNMGMRAARGDCLLFCDGDDVVAPGWLSAMVAQLRHCDVVGGRNDEDLLNQGVARCWDPPAATDRLPRELDFLQYAPGSNMGVRAGVLHTIRGFNEEYTRRVDVEFSWRAQLAAYRLGFAPDEVVHYRLRRSSRLLARQFFGYGRCDAQLFGEFHRDGVRRSSLRTAVRTWGWIIVHGPDVLVERRRERWLHIASHRCGRLWGSLHHRVLFL